MPPRNGIMLPGAVPQQPVVQQVAVAAPINDIQLVVLAAAALYGQPGVGPARHAVEIAQEIVAEAVVGQGRVGELVAARKRAIDEMEAAAKAASHTD